MKVRRLDIMEEFSESIHQLSADVEVTIVPGKWSFDLILKGPTEDITLENLRGAKLHAPEEIG